ncbi:MAG: IS256 family transposase, partial [Bacteroidota bacterium]
MTQATTDWNSLKEEAIKRLRTSKELSGKDGALIPLIKDLLETALEAELTEHLKEEQAANRRNGKTTKTVKSDYGPVVIQTSRDRQATFEPQLVIKRQTTLGSALINNIMALWCNGMSYSDISAHVEELYGLEVSESTLTGITDALIPKVKAWQNRPLDGVYPIVWLDAIHFKVREEGRVISKAVYCVLGLNQQGKKELLGMYVGQNESASFWLNVLTELKNRGVEDILIACIDNLKGFKEAISSIYPQTELQQCIVHQLRNSMRYVSYKDRKALMKDLKTVYQANTADMAEVALEVVASKWESK